MTKITMPVRQDGVIETLFGDRPVKFEDGVAEVDFEINDGLKAYLLGNGYGVGDTAPVELAPEPAPADPRDYDTELVGTPLRDAAVDPDFDVDFLPPTNAGDANPHGPEVVAPGLHGVGPGPIVPGTVGSADYQEAKETATAEAVLSGDAKVPDVTAALGKLAAQEYELTKADGPERGMAQELTDEERDLIGDLPEDEDDAVEDAETLKGDALTQALKDRELSLTGTADQKRARVAEYDAAQV